jgi:cytochrome c oxidase subunit 2
MAQEDLDTRTDSERLADVENKTPVIGLFAIATVASLLGIFFGLLIDWFPVQGSTQAEQIDTVWDVLIICSVPMFVLVTTVVLYCAIRFRQRPGEEDKDGPPIHGNTRLEIIWTAIPALMMLALCTYAYVVLRDIEEAPANPASELNVRVVGEQFAWTFFYPTEGQEEVASTQLYLPVNRSVKFTVQSKDVLHDFWVPAFRMKIDAVPGIDTGYRVTPSRTGNFPVVCAELCGLGHAVMRQTARVLPAQEFEAWLAEQGQEGGAEPGGQGEGAPSAPGGQPPAGTDGKTLFSSVEPKCSDCHTLADAGATGTIGPDLGQSLKGKDEAYIRAAIVDPEAQIAEGFAGGIMPPVYGDTLDDAEIDALVKYLLEQANG